MYDELDSSTGSGGGSDSKDTLTSRGSILGVMRGTAIGVSGPGAAGEALRVCHALYHVMPFLFQLDYDTFLRFVPANALVRSCTNSLHCHVFLYKSFTCRLWRQWWYQQDGYEC